MVDETKDTELKTRILADLMNSPFGIDWRETAWESIRYMDERTDADGLTEYIRNAEAIGERRKPREHHVVVHPEFAFNPDCAVKSLRDEYAASIQCILRTHDPVVITYPHAREDYGHFAYDAFDGIQSVDPRKVQQSIVGYLDAQGARSLLHAFDGLNDKDTYVIHGSAFGRCTSQFAMQLYALTEHKLYPPPSTSAMPATAPERIARGVIGHLAISTRDARRRIRWGVLHNSQGERWDELEIELADSHTHVLG